MLASDSARALNMLGIRIPQVMNLKNSTISQEPAKKLGVNKLKNVILFEK